MRQLLAFRRLAHDPQSVLAAVYGLALVSIELLLNVEISIFKALPRKLDIAACADAQHRNAFGAFNYSELASGHDNPDQRIRVHRLSCGNQTAPPPKGRTRGPAFGPSLKCPLRTRSARLPAASAAH